DRHLRLNLTAFHYDYSDLQVRAFISPGVSDISNAATAKIDGIEFEAMMLPIPNLRIVANVSYLDARYSKYPQAPGPGGIIIDASGKQMNAAPKFSGNVVVQYDIPLAAGDLSFRGEYFRQARSYFVANNDPEQSQAAYDLVNASVSYTLPDDRFQVGLFGKNLANTQFVTGTASFTAAASGRPGDPRTYGVRASFKY
ncbi:MAG: TonB-dependent receptor, partial [Sphingomonas bacterium]|uniref:TonB-dependent receptor domain-containing protein n=1 Tax=Sphingomonas bacterium TaxID=1895847 RepID=UPI0026375E70